MKTDAARDGAYRAAQARQKLQREETRRLRAGGDDAQAFAAELDRSQAAAGEAWTSFDKARGGEVELLRGMASLLDPREHVGEFDDAVPILLLPLRVETRFAPGANELWVRVFPDAWAVDGFEPMLSETEIVNAQSFWADFWAAGDGREMQVAAWRNLVASHGEGRATWIVTSYRPINEEDRPGAAAAGTLTLAIDGAQPADAEAEAIRAYWEETWRHPDDADAQAAARSALDGAMDAAAAEAAIAQPPRRLADPFSGADRDTVTLRLVWIEWPALAAEEVKAASWSAAARTDMLPERLVVTLQSGKTSRSEIGAVIPATVTLGFDPGAPDADQIEQVDGELRLPEAMAWIFDFDKAVTMGLAMRIALSAAERRAGFDRIIACGLCLRDDAGESGVKLERLIAHHHASRTDFTLLPQGTPTNNSDTTSGWSAADDVEGSFARVFENALPELDEADPWRRSDGQWLAEWLGLDPAAIAPLAHADGRDQLEARAINRALWPATIGYSLDTLLDGVIDEDNTAATRRYFEAYVQARDCIPQIRIGDQPYGVLPASAWSKHRWFAPRRGDNGGDRALNRTIGNFLAAQLGSGDYLGRLFTILGQADAQWADLVAGAAHIGRAGDMHQTLLDILGLAPNSLEFHRRNADTMEHYFNLMRAQGLGGLFASLLAQDKNDAALALLRDLGYSGEERPAILRFVFHEQGEALGTLLVDDVAPSEESPVRFYTDDDRNYLRWLIDAGSDSLEALRMQQGFSGDELPSALLYHLARHALQLGYWDVGMRLRGALDTQTSGGAALDTARREAPFLHIEEAAETSASRYYHLYRPEPAITGDQTMLLQEHVAHILPTAPEGAEYRSMLTALEDLEQTPTARLERLLIEHLDLCTYRLDAWKQGILQLQLEFMRRHHPSRSTSKANAAADGAPARGLYLGAYGWLENVRPRSKALAPASVPGDLRKAFDADRRPLVEDPDNLGYIHAPSLDQAQTAAVLRNSYVANAAPGSPKTMAINLTSWRVRQAMAVLEGMRNDQSLGELLGYRLERELHENFALAETDQFIFAFRKHFPLVANKLQTTYEDLPAGESIETIEARNVVDGEALLAHLGESGATTYPFDLADMPAASPAQRSAIEAAIDLIANVSDAVADLALAESVHQAMKGKPDSAAATLDAQGSGLFPPQPEFVATPREGVSLTLRSAIMLDTAPASTAAWPGVAASPRGDAEPILNQWLASLFPAPEDIIVEIDDASGNPPSRISLADLGRQPIDWLYDLRLDDRNAVSALDQLIEAHYRVAHAPVDPKAVLAIGYRHEIAGKTSLYCFAPLVDAARTLVTTARPLRGGDIALASQAADEREGAPALPRSRADDSLALLDTLATDAGSFLAPVDTELVDSTANAAAIRAALKDRLTAFEALATRAAQFGLRELDASIGIRWRRRWCAELDGRRAALIADWERRLAEFHGYIARYDALPAAAPHADIFRPLQRAERQISTTITQPLPDDPATMRADLATRALAFEQRLDEIRAARDFLTDDADAYLAKTEDALPLTDFVPEDFRTASAQTAFAAPTAEMAAGVRALIAAIGKRRSAAETKLTEHDATNDSEQQVGAVTSALKAIFGEEFVALPTFTLTAAQQAELQLCAANEEPLLRHQTATLGDPLPLETWLHSTARVRDRMATFEYLGMACEALTGLELPLAAWQLPHAPDDHWLGAAYPDSHTITGDLLLFQAHHALAFNAAGAQAGLLIDEWTEVIPKRDLLTGVAFHFDQPNSEPPQAFLLMTPTQFRGSWTWSDIVDGLNETLDAAQWRAVEPAQIDATAWAPFLPATLASTTHFPLSITLNYAVANGFARTMVEEEG